MSSLWKTRLRWFALGTLATCLWVTYKLMGSLW
jgi:hypothetical protein